jgi:hypothetical protein
MWSFDELGLPDRMGGNEELGIEIYDSLLSGKVFW